MADVHSIKTRSYNMSRIKGKNTKPEILVRQFLFSKGFRYRLHPKKMSGRPDIVLPKYKTVIFVHGCFWHSHPRCKYFKLPKSNADWWAEKLLKNISNDTKAMKELRKLGWRVLVVWECELKKGSRVETLQKLVNKFS